MSNEPKGFRDYEWFIDKDRIPNLKPVPDCNWYVKADENLFYEGFKAKQIQYFFNDNLLEGVVIEYDTCNVPVRIYSTLCKQLTIKYGAGKVDERSTFWHGNSACVKIQDIYNDGNCSNVELAIYNPRIFSEKSRILRHFSNSIAKEWEGYSKKFENTAALDSLRKWIDNNKPKELTSYSLENGRKISVSLYFEGAPLLLIELENPKANIESEHDQIK